VLLACVQPHILCSKYQCLGSALGVRCLRFRIAAVMGQVFPLVTVSGAEVSNSWPLISDRVSCSNCFLHLSETFYVLAQLTTFQLLLVQQSLASSDVFTLWLAGFMYCWHSALSHCLPFSTDVRCYSTEAMSDWEDEVDDSPAQVRRKWI
jgi:hypothetical protein